MPTLRILGVYEDGSPRADGVPPSARQSLAITQGAQTVLELTVVTPAGVALDLTAQTSLVLTFAIRRTYIGMSRTPDLQLTGALVPAAGTNRADFTITSDNTSTLIPGRYSYDLWLSSTELGRQPLVPTSPLRLEPAVLLP